MKENPLVLIVDHQPDNLLTYTRYLETHAPVRVVTAVSGIEAVLKAKRFQPDLILLDPHHLLALKSDPDTREIPLVLLQGDVSADSERVQASLHETVGAAQ